MAKTSTDMSALSLFLLLLVSAAAGRRTCYNGTFYFHDILYNGNNLDNYTSAIIGSPPWGNKTTLAKPNNFGNLAIFDDPITLDNDLHSAPVGRARGFYLYDDKATFGSWVGFSFALNYTGGKGTINFAGADPLMEKSRDISVIGGTGDFLMARGMATLRTDAYEGDAYFRLCVEIMLYECREYWVN